MQVCSRRSVGIHVLLATCTLAAPQSQSCKTLPEQLPKSTWDALNTTLSGHLIAPIPPGGVCHPDQPNYNANLCPSFEARWTTDWTVYTEDPIQNAYQNWNDDSCYPYAELGLPCSGAGFPSYVVNATTAAHVQAGVDFARDNNVRLVVKATGHDFRGRSVAPKALSIWVHHLKGLVYHEAFTPAGQCKHTTQAEAALTVAAGENHGTAFAEAHRHNRAIMAGGGPSVGPGGYSLGGGHSLLSVNHGLAADNMLEASVVTPDGQIVTANECQHSELFWGLRGGGGSTLGVALNMTYRVFPEDQWTTYGFAVVATPNSTLFWDAVTYLAGQLPAIADSGIMAYIYMVPGNATTGDSLSGLFGALGKSVSETDAILLPVLQHINATFGAEVIATTTPTHYATVWDYWSTNPDESTPIGIDLIIASRLLDKKALTHPNFRSLIQQATPPTGFQFFLISGPGVHKFANDSKSLLPAWRSAYVHTIIGTGWAPFDQTDAAKQINLLTNDLGAALRELAPDTGSYMNEGNAFEPDFQQAFWGANYPRLLAIKREVDPLDVFWCLSCAGSERLKAVGDTLCTV